MGDQRSRAIDAGHGTPMHEPHDGYGVPRSKAPRRGYDSDDSATSDFSPEPPAAVPSVPPPLAPPPAGPGWDERQYPAWGTPLPPAGVAFPPPGPSVYQVEDGEQTPITRMVNEGLRLSGLPPRYHTAPTHPPKTSLYTSTVHVLSPPHVHGGLTDAPPPSSNRPQPVRSGSSGSRPQLAPIVTGSGQLAPTVPSQVAPTPGPFSARNSALQVPNILDGVQEWLAEPVLPSPMQARLGPFSALREALGAAFTFPELPSALDHPLDPLPATSPKDSPDRREVLERNMAPQDVPQVVVTSTAPPEDTVAEGPAPTAAPAPPSETQPPQVPQPSQLAPDAATVQGDDDPQAQTAAVARHIWQHGIRDVPDLPENLARAAAAQLITYPTLMVLPEPTSPVPPFVFRPWLARIRSALPASLAIARSVLAGYLVRLPASLPTVWMNIARELHSLIRSAPQTAAGDDLSLFASTAALWLYLVLALLTEEPIAAQYIDDHAVNSGLHALSTLASSLSTRVLDMDRERARLRTSEAGPEMNFEGWGLLESMRRTLFAAYTLLVLQRLREGVEGLQAAVAGVELVMDVALPADDTTFNVTTEADWRSAYTAARQRSKVSLLSLGEPAGQAERMPTLRDLLRARSKRHDGAPLIDVFAHADEFTNVTLAVALGLDGLAPTP